MDRKLITVGAAAVALVGALAFGQAVLPQGSMFIAPPITGGGTQPVLTCQNATATDPGCVSTSTQTFGGPKTLDTALTITGPTSGNTALVIPTDTKISNGTQAVAFNASGIESNTTLKSVTASHNTLDVGSASLPWRSFFVLGTTSAAGVRGTVTNGATAIATRWGSANALSTDGAEILTLYSDDHVTKVAAVDKDGKLIYPTGGAADVVGTATLSGGTATVSTTAIETGSKVFLSHSGTGTAANFGVLYPTSIAADTGFIINSTNASDNDQVEWRIIN